MNWLPQRFRRHSLYSDLAEEMRQHLDEKTEQLMREGMSPKQAGQAARRAFGNAVLLEERSREVWQWPTLESIGADLKYAFRQLRKSPGFTFTVILSLALGIGANTTIFTFVNALLFLPPRVADASHVVEVMQRNPKASGIDSYLPLSYPGYATLRDHNRTLSGMAAFDGDPHSVSWSSGGSGQMVYGQLVSGNFFSILGIEPTLGRAFNADEDRAGAPHPVIVVSHSFWQHRLAADSAVIGRVLTLNGTSYTIIGVAPAGFTGVLIGSQPDFWAPLAMAPTFIHDNDLLGNSDSYWLFALGRLKPDVPAKQVQADLSALSLSMPPSTPKSNVLDAVTFPVQLIPGPYRGYVAAFTGILMVAAGLVLLIACANAANLVLARAIARRRELAVRSALGASRFRILRQTLTESLLLSLIGGAGGLLLATFAIPSLQNFKPANIPLFIATPIDWRVFTFAIFLSLCCAIVFGVLPARRGQRRDLLPALRDEPLMAGPRRSRLRSVIVITQITVCLVLLISTGLCLRSLFNARSIDPGFDTHNIALAQVDPGSLGYTEAQGRQFYRQLLDRVRALPGVTSASLADLLPLGTGRSLQTVNVDGFTPPRGADGFGIQFAQIAPGYFATMGIPVFAGRDFTPADTHPHATAVVINQAMANRFWPNQSALGQHIKTSHETFEVVGIVKTGKYNSLGEGPQSFVYRPLDYSPHAFLVVRSQSTEQSSLTEIRNVLRTLDPNLVPMDMEPISQYMALPLFAAHTTGVLLAAFGAIALLLATIGLSGVISYSVSQRTNEIGVRMALGADRLNVVNLILKQGMRLTGIGILCGLTLSFAATRLLSGLLYGIKSTDPLTYVAVTLLLASVASLSCYLPARRAASIDPMKALRAE